MTLDLLGTCYTDQLRPPPLKPYHIAQWLSQNSSANANGDATNKPQPAAELTSAGIMLGSNQELIAAGEASGLVLGTSALTTADATMQAEAQVSNGQSALLMSQCAVLTMNFHCLASMWCKSSQGIKLAIGSSASAACIPSGRLFDQVLPLHMP